MIIESYNEEFDKAVILLGKIEDKILEKDVLNQEDQKILESIQTSKNILSDMEYLRFRYNLQ